MSAADVELVRRWFKGFEVGELSPEICASDIEIRNWEEAPDTGPYHGHEGMRQWWRDMEDAFEDVRLVLIDATDVGDGRVVTAQRILGSFRQTGIGLEHTWGAVVTVRDGKIASAIGYLSPGRARRAAGL